MLRQKPMPLDKVVSVYTLATVGDGLSNPASGAFSVHRIGNYRNAGRLKQQFRRGFQPADFVTACHFDNRQVILLFISLIPGLPKIPIFVLAALTIVLGYTLFKSYNRAKIMSEEKNMEQMARNQESRRVLCLCLI